MPKVTRYMIVDDMDEEKPITKAAAKKMKARFEKLFCKTVITGKNNSTFTHLKQKPK